jgi:hypothetical protein
VTFHAKKRVRMISTLDLVRHDLCPRLQTWSRFETPRISLAEALNHALRVGLTLGDPAMAHGAFMSRAADPGLDIEGGAVYDIAVHHAALIETICAYLLGDGAWEPAKGDDTFTPLSYQMPDGRLRRIILCSTWNPLREAEERASWWTVADTAFTGRPMLINVIVIGSSRGGFRLSPWTTAYQHPENDILRIKRKEGRFSEGWKRLYREATDLRPLDWLTLMQQDDAFEGIVESFTVDSPTRRVEILADMARMAKEIEEGHEEMRRSACYRHAPCPMARLCHNPRPLEPEGAGWRLKNESSMIASG